MNSAERREEIAYAINEFVNYRGIPLVTPYAFLMDVESCVGFELHPDERAFVTNWFVGTGLAQ